MAFPAAPTESGSAKIHFLTTDGNSAAGWFGVTEGPTTTGANTVGFAAIATHVEGDAVAAPGGLNTTGTDVPVVLVAGDDGTNAVPLQLSGTDLKITLDSEAVVLGAGTAEIGKLAAGTAAIGKLAANSGVDIGDVDIIGAALTALQLIDDSVFADDAAFTLTSSKATVAGAIRDDALSTLTAVESDAVPLRVNSTGALHVTGGGGGIEYNEDDATPAPIVGTASLMERDDVLSTLTPMAGDVAADRGPAESALWTQDFTSDAILTAVELIDDAISGSEMQVDVVAALPAGTNAIGKLAANSGVDIGDVDVLSTIPGTGATNLGKAIDSVGGATDTGVAALVIRDDPRTTLTPVD